MAFSAQATPLINLFELGIQQGKTEQYDQVGEQNIRTSIQDEKGTLAMFLLKQKDDPQMAYMVEIYANQTAYEQHLLSPQYRHFVEKSPEILTDHKKRFMLEPQFLADKPIINEENTVAHLIFVDVKAENNLQFKSAILAEMSQRLEKDREKDNAILATYIATLKDQPNQWVFLEITKDIPPKNTFVERIKSYQHLFNSINEQAVKPAFLGSKGAVLFKNKSF